VHAYSDWYYYMVMNPADWIQTVWIRILPDPEKTPDIQPDPDLDPDPVHLYLMARSTVVASRR